MTHTSTTEWSPPDEKRATLTPADHTNSRTRIHADWLPATDGQRQPHLPAFPGFALLGLADFECQNDEQGLLAFRVPVYRNDLFAVALMHAGIELDKNGSHPAAEFILLPPPGVSGEYQMGPPPGHRVKFARPFLFARTQLVQAVYSYVMTYLPPLPGQPNLDPDPAAFKGPLRPVETVSWYDAVEFCRRAGLRLPSEAEWEYACRAGSTTAYTFGEQPQRLGKFAWFADNSGGETHPVATLEHNAFGLYDCHGNVWEWCRDPWHNQEEGVAEDGRAWGEPPIDPYSPMQVRLPAYGTGPHDLKLADVEAILAGYDTGTSEANEEEQKQEDPFAHDGTLSLSPFGSTHPATGTRDHPDAGVTHTTEQGLPPTTNTSGSGQQEEDEEGSDPTRPTCTSTEETASDSTGMLEQAATGTPPIYAPSFSESAQAEDEHGADPSHPIALHGLSSAAADTGGAIPATSPPAAAASAPQEDGEQRPAPTASPGARQQWPVATATSTPAGTPGSDFEQPAGEQRSDPSASPTPWPRQPSAAEAATTSGSLASPSQGTDPMVATGGTTGGSDLQEDDQDAGPFGPTTSTATPSAGVHGIATRSTSRSGAHGTRNAAPNHPADSGQLGDEQRTAPFDPTAAVAGRDRAGTGEFRHTASRLADVRPTASRQADSEGALLQTNSGTGGSDQAGGEQSADPPQSASSEERGPTGSRGQKPPAAGAETAGSTTGPRPSDSAQSEGEQRTDPPAFRIPESESLRHSQRSAALATTNVAPRTATSTSGTGSSGLPDPDASGSEQAEGEQGTDPTANRDRGRAQAFETAAGTERPSSAAIPTGSGTHTTRAAASAGSAPREGEQRTDPPVPTQPVSSSSLPRPSNESSAEAGTTTSTGTSRQPQIAPETRPESGPPTTVSESPAGEPALPSIAPASSTSAAGALATATRWDTPTDPSLAPSPPDTGSTTDSDRQGAEQRPRPISRDLLSTESSAAPTTAPLPATGPTAGGLNETGAASLGTPGGPSSDFVPEDEHRPDPIPAGRQPTTSSEATVFTTATTSATPHTAQATRRPSSVSTGVSDAAEDEQGSDPTFAHRPAAYVAEPDTKTPTARVSAPTATTPAPPTRSDSARQEGEQCRRPTNFTVAASATTLTTSTTPGVGSAHRNRPGPHASTSDSGSAYDWHFCRGFSCSTVVAEVRHPEIPNPDPVRTAPFFRFSDPPDSRRRQYGIRLSAG